MCQRASSAFLPLFVLKREQEYYKVGCSGELTGVKYLYAQTGQVL